MSVTELILYFRVFSMNKEHALLNVLELAQLVRLSKHTL